MTPHHPVFLLLFTTEVLKSNYWHLLSLLLSYSPDQFPLDFLITIIQTEFFLSQSDALYKSGYSTLLFKSSKGFPSHSTIQSCFHDLLAPTSSPQKSLPHLANLIAITISSPALLYEMYFKCVKLYIPHLSPQMLKLFLYCQLLAYSSLKIPLQTIEQNSNSAWHSWTIIIWRCLLCGLFFSILLLPCLRIYPFILLASAHTILHPLGIPSLIYLSNSTYPSKSGSSPTSPLRLA